jgi:hypothetical protein
MTIGSSTTTVASDAIWDAAGDLAVGSGADTAAKLSLGASGKVPVSNGSTLVYAYPPGYEFDYVQITSPVNVTGTSEAAATAIVTGSAVSYDGSTAVIVDFFAPYYTTLASNDNLSFYLYDGSSSIGRMGLVTNNSSSLSSRTPPHLSRRITPSNASHTYSIRGVVPSGTGVVGAGNGTISNDAAAFIRITKAA